MNNDASQWTAFPNMSKKSTLVTEALTNTQLLVDSSARMLRDSARRAEQNKQTQAEAARASGELTTNTRERLEMLEAKLRISEAENKKLKDAAQRNQDGSKIWVNQRIVSNEEAGRVWDLSRNFIRVFLSHKTGFKKEVAALKHQLRGYGLDCFVAHEDIETSEKWQKELENALLTMDVFIAILTSDFHDSDWTAQEIGFACARNVSQIAVRMGRDPYGFMREIQGLNSEWADMPLKIMLTLKKHPKMVDALIDAIAICPSAEVGNKLATLFKRVEALSDIQLVKFIANYNANQQVYGSYEMNGSGDIENSIIPHLKRMTGRKFSFDKNRIVEEPST